MQLCQATKETFRVARRLRMDNAQGRFNQYVIVRLRAKEKQLCARILLLKTWEIC